MELMGYNYDSLSVVSHITQNVKQSVCFLWRKHCRRFVQYEYIGSPVKHFYDFHRLFFRNGHVVYFFVGVKFKTVLVYKSVYLFHDLVHFYNFFSGKSENYIFRRRKCFYQLKMLMYHTYSQLKRIGGTCYFYLFPVYDNFTLIGKINTGKHIHKSCFTASVFAQKRKNFTLSYFERNIFIGNNFSEVFTYFFQLYRVCALQYYSSFFFKQNGIRAGPPLCFRPPCPRFQKY